MMYLDESGDDGKRVKSNSELFAVAVYDDISDEFRKINNEIRLCLKYKNRNLKWNKLNREQKVLFSNFVHTNFIDTVYVAINVKKYNNNLTYLEICKYLFFRLGQSKNKVVYKGVHLKSMFHKIHLVLKDYNKSFSFYESKGDQYLGIEISDLYAGYVRHCLTNSLEISSNIKCYYFD